MTANIYQHLLKGQEKPQADELHHLLNSRTTALAKKGEVLATTPDEEGYFDAAHKTLIEGAGGRPLRGWQLALKGFYEGASAGKNKKKIEELKKVAQGLSYVEEQGNKASEMLMEKRKMKEAEEAIVPSLKNYLQKADSLSPRDRMDFLGNIVKQYNAMAGTDFAIDAVDGVNPANITLSSKKMGVQNVDLLNSPLFKGLKENIERERLTRQAENFTLDQQKIEKNRLNIDQQRVNAYNKDIDNRWNPQSHFDVNAGKTQGAEGNKMALKLQESNLELEDVAYDIAFLKDLLKDGHVITGDTLKAKSSRLWAESAGNQALSDSELYDATAKSLLKFANNSASFGNANQKEFEFLKAPVPDSHKTKAANERLLERFSDKLKKQISRNEKVISQYESFNPYQPQTTGVTPPSEKNAGTTEEKGGGTNENIAYTKMKKPDGTIVAVPTSKVYEKMQLDYKLIK